MKMSLANISNQMINKFDQELLMLIKEDLQNQKGKIKNKLIHLRTVKFDHELYQIIKKDIQFIREQLCNQQRTLAHAG